MTRRVALLLPLLLIVAGCSGSDRGDRAEPTRPGQGISLGTGDAPPANAFEAAAGAVNGDSQFPKDAALRLFALQYGDVPGGAAPPGDPGPPQSGTISIDAVFSVWSELDDTQRAAIRERLDLPSDFTPATPAAPPSAPGTGGPGRTRPMENDPAPFRQQLEAMRTVMERRLGPLGAELAVEAYPLLPRGSGAGAVDRTTTHADTLLVAPDRCRIRVATSLVQTSTRPSDILGHELFHCFQQRWAGTEPGPVWVEEGSADWAGAQAAIEAGGIIEGRTLITHIGRYYRTPAKQLFDRTYDAFGWFAYVAETGVDLWSRLRPMLEARNSVGAYQAAGVSGAEYAAGWASNQTDEPSWGARWVITGPGVPSFDNQARINYVELANRTNRTVSALPYAVGQAAMSLRADLVRFNAIPPTAGWVRSTNGQERALAELANQVWCTGPDCTCPPGTARAGQSFPRLDMRDVFIAVNGADSASSLTVQGSKLDDECGQEQACPIGKWKLNTPPVGIPATTVRSGGTGTIITIDSRGDLTMDFSEYVPLVATDNRDSRTSVRYEPAGFLTARISVPANAALPQGVPITPGDVSRFTGTGSITVSGTSIPLTAGELQAVALGGAGSRNAELSCTGPNEFTISAGGVTQTYQRVS